MKNISLFVYGSLMSGVELDSMFEDYTIIKAKLFGFVRDYSKKSHSWGEKGVLGITKNPEEWCNGLIISGITSEEFKKYCERELGVSLKEYFETETGYNIHKLDNSRLEPYDEEEKLPPNIYTVTTNLRLEKNNIHQNYKNLCETAAQSLGQEFYTDFIETTYEYYDGEFSTLPGVDRMEFKSIISN